MTLPTPTEAPATFSGLRVALVGLGIEGQDALTFLDREGASVIRVDRDPNRADRSQDDLSLLDEIDAVVASQGVHYQVPLLVEAARRGVAVYGPMQLLLERCPAEVIGITGSAGKTTTTTLVHLLLEAAGVNCHVGGNIGQGFLSRLPEISAGDTVVAEISHTQLLRTTRSPQTAAITNITPNHLDQFSWDEYQHLKYRLVEYQRRGDSVALPTDDDLAAAAATKTPASPRWFGFSRTPGSATPYATVDGDRIVVDGSPIMPVDQLRIPGRHNLLNALAALAIVADRAPLDVASDVLRDFRGVEHRLELVAEVDGVRFVNDSIATTPERAVAGLRAIQGSIVLLLGGRDKHLPLDPLLSELRRHVRLVALFGEAGPTWSDWLSSRGVDVVLSETLDSAFAEAAKTAQPCETVLMSPAGTSFDAFPNFEARGRRFRELVDEWANARRSPKNQEAGR